MLSIPPTRLLLKTWLFSSSICRKSKFVLKKSFSLAPTSYWFKPASPSFLSKSESLKALIAWNEVLGSATCINLREMLLSSLAKFTLLFIILLWLSISFPCITACYPMGSGYFSRASSPYERCRMPRRLFIWLTISSCFELEPRSSLSVRGASASLAPLVLSIELAGRSPESIEDSP